MNLLNDIRRLVEKDDEHHIKIEVDALGVKISLDYDPTLDYDEKCVIPIYYSTVDEFCYIPHDEYCETFQPTDYGMDFSEVKLVGKIMQYLEEHKQEINKLCKGYCIGDREIYKKKHDNKENSNDNV